MQSNSSSDRRPSISGSPAIPKPLLASVVKATNKDFVSPKAKHVRILVEASWSKEISISEIFRALHARLLEPHWIISLKTLITLHAMLKDGCTSRIYGHLVDHLDLFNMSGFIDKKRAAGIVQSRHIRSYASYLEEKVFAFRDLRIEYACESSVEAIRNLRYMTLSDHLFHHIDVLIRQIRKLLDSRFMVDDVDNEITLCAFQYLIKDLLKLYHALNELVINMLSKYFTFSKEDARTGLELYREFTKVTDKIVKFCTEADRLKRLLGFALPKLTPAPTSIIVSLQSYLQELESPSDSPAEEKRRHAAFQEDAVKSELHSMSQQTNLLIDLDFEEPPSYDYASSTSETFSQAGGQYPTKTSGNSTAPVSVMDLFEGPTAPDPIIHHASSSNVSLIGTTEVEQQSIPQPITEFASFPRQDSSVSFFSINETKAPGVPPFSNYPAAGSFQENHNVQYASAAPHYQTYDASAAQRLGYSQSAFSIQSSYPSCTSNFTPSRLEHASMSNMTSSSATYHPSSSFHGAPSNWSPSRPPTNLPSSTTPTSPVPKDAFADLLSGYTGKSSK